MHRELRRFVRAAVLAAAGVVASVPVALAQAPAAPGAAAPAQPEGVAVRVRGVINSLDGNVLGFTTREGEVISIVLSDGFTVTAAVPLTLADVVNNAYIGVAAEEDAAGNLVALDLRVFPEAARGRGEGVRPWDLTPAATMTNATVAAVEQQGGQTLVRVTFPDGERVFVVGPDTSIWTTTEGDRSLLVPGAFAVIGTRLLANGTYTATSVTVEKEGTRPTN